MDSFYVENNLTAEHADPGIIAPIYNIRYPVSVISLPASGFPLKKIYNQAIKRSFDIIVSIILIPAILLWMIPLFAILIKLDSRGPVFFRQKRNSKGGGTFTCIKFRTMIVNKEADLVAASEEDERITRFGKFLRDHYLDELPQLFNVLLGHMSIIGPRPHMLSDNLKYEKLINNYSSRHKVKPGMTGLAQVRGYSGPINSFQEIKARIHMDIFYIRHWSPRLDMVILYRTIRKSLGI
ncbi:MAG: sugar transferase [Ferruginibacter sp.]